MLVPSNLSGVDQPIAVRATASLTEDVNREAKEWFSVLQGTNADSKTTSVVKLTA
jgi:hypothetical protein